MANYRLEIWFDFKHDNCDWGVAQATANASDTTPFQSGGTAIRKNGKKVSLPQSSEQPFDIYVFDKTGDDAGRVLQWIAIDYEQTSNPQQGQTANPIESATSLRTGMTGDDFMGTQVGGAEGTTSGNGKENNIVCAGDVLANRRWSLIDGYTEDLAAGNYDFTIAFVIGSPTEKQVKAFGVDPEMDIQT